jgi:6-phosphogluconolactonase
MATQSSYFAYIGNYGKKEPQGIILMRYQAGRLEPAGQAAEAREPNFLAAHPSGKFVYAVTAHKLADYHGAVEAFAVDEATGKLTLLNRQPSGGDHPAHIAIDPTGKAAVVANYSGGTIASFPINADGRLAPAASVIQHHGSSINQKRQKGPHPHGITFNATGDTILVPDLGADRIFIYRVELATAKLTTGEPAVLPPGSGPRHAAFGNGDRFIYVINELTYTLSVFSNDNPPREIETIRVWEDKPNASGAEIEIHPNGKFLYASNRVHDSIAICSIDRNTGRLTLVGIEPTGGKTPRHFGLDPTGEFLLASNMDSNAIDVFAVNPATGKLTHTGQRTPTDLPCSIAFVRMNQR